VAEVAEVPVLWSLCVESQEAELKGVTMDLAETMGLSGQDLHQEFPDL
jgi:hypothetical protein